tara:strand:+ start:64 stop:1596 length:1533 start_codon:yes stop_codon:yes gene_type:complete
MPTNINADNGVVSGIAGLKTSADNSGVLALQTNGTTGLTVNASQAIGVGSTPSFGTSGQVLTSGGSSAAPTWTTVGGGGSAATPTALGTVYGNTNTASLVFVGYQAGNSNTAADNTGLGYRSGYSTSSGANNTSVGSQSLYSNTTGSENVAIGVPALYANQTGDSNTAVGAGSLVSNTNSKNTGVGTNALNANTSGTRNTAVGNSTLAANTAGSYNTAVGGNHTGVTGGTLNSNTSGSYNVALGVGALGSNTTSSNSTAVGYQAGNGSTGTANQFFGYNSGSAVTSGAKNVILGSYNGNQGSLDIRTASNYIVLSDGDGNPRGIFNSSGDFLVGATAKENNEKFRVYTTGFEAIRLSNSDLNGYTLLTKSQVTSASTHYVMGFLNFAGSVAGGITHNDSTTTYATSSDYRLKNITGNLTGYKERLMGLLPKQGTWLANGSEFKGFLAHEFANSYSGSVIGEKDAVDADGKPIMQSMQASSTEVMADLIAMVKDLITENQSLKARLDAANL